MKLPLDVSMPRAALLSPQLALAARVLIWLLLQPAVALLAVGTTSVAPPATLTLPVVL